jgi:hypothetical protein
MHRLRNLLVTTSTVLIGCVGTDIVSDSTVTIPARIEITPRAAAVQVGAETTFAATYFDSLGNESAAVFVWQSLHPAIAAIDQTGLASGVMPGQAMLVASAQGVSSQPALLTVVADANQVATVAVTPDSGAIQVGATLQFSATASNLDGGTIEDVTFTWASSAPNVATIDGSGLATAIGVGSANIAATADGVESAPAFLEVLPESRSGTFTKRPGTSYNVSGAALLQQESDGRLRLKFGDDFTCSSGPGLAVFLSSGQSVGASSLNLGNLKSTSGAQIYEVPSEVELMTFDWIIIHCVPFNVTFGYAQLQ